MRQEKVRDMVLISIFAALTAIGAFIRIPLPYVPMTMQFFFCAFAGILLGAKKGMLSQVLYVMIGLLGIPIFTEGGGFNYIFKPTFGYLLGFILCAFLIGLMTERIKNLDFKKMLSIILIGLLSVYLVGVPYLYMIVNYYLGGQMTVKGALIGGFIPFVGADIVKGIIVASIALKVVPRIKRYI